MDFTLDKTERLCSKKALDALFSGGKSKSQFPVKVIYKTSVYESEFPARVVFIVPKKKHKRANKRNTIRRRMREVYRLNKHPLYNSLKTEKLDVMFVYLSNEIADYAKIESCMVSLMEHISKQEHH
ncbi:MAG: ribonuclease P protein component [Bacteroidota bacterium]